ncbi:MAG: precorrin-6A reductase [Planctomycetaceae bacterium]|jgi:precorrin-2 dehydrogenase/sirohydrochlorin ferrochelatase/precorrin-6A/cobalt-precorrin-6A reductase|nr:precorrin-6A reductase [Planctomycetaceae bacterium]
MKVLLFGGTTEAGKLAQSLADHNIDVTLIVATEYGKKLFQEPTNFTITAQRLNETEMTAYLKTHPFDYAVDATHPYADKVTRNIQSACQTTNTKYLRLLRRESDKNPFITYVADTKEAIDLLNRETGKILFTIGSKELEHFVQINDFISRSYVRILPMLDSLRKTIDLGVRNSNIICMQGPVSEKMNKAMIEMTEAEFLVTKNSGEIGGWNAKISAALQCRCRVIVLPRPTQETGFSYSELLDFFKINPRIESEQNRTELNPKSRHRFFPLFMDLRNKKILIIGGGKIAQRRTEILHSFGAKITLLSISITKILEETVRCGEIHFVNKKYEKGDIDRFHPFLVIAATNNREVNQSIAQDAKEKGIFVIVSDNRDECNSYFPAIIENESYLAGLVSKQGDHHGVRIKAEQIRKLLNNNSNH